MKYKITFNTGNIKGAGTDAKVSIQIFGTKIITNPLTLSTQFKDFERDRSDDFFIETSELGEIEKIKINLNNRFIGSDWYLDDVIIESSSSSKTWYFPIFKWIKEDQDLSVKSKKSARYYIEISTGTLPGSGTKDTIQISLVGKNSYTPFISINKYISNKEFKTGHIEKFSRIFEDIGKIHSIYVKSLGDSFNSNWFLSRIKIKKERENKFTALPFHTWVRSGKISSSIAGLDEYTIKFYTGNVATGGTDANVNMILHGSKCDTEPIELNKLIARNAFESGNTDYIKLPHKKLGIINKITIWHDEKWPADGWFLNKITIRNDRTGTMSEFPYYSWLDKSTNPKSTKIVLNKEPIEPRPFYVIAHMVNTPSYVEEALDLGSNAIEFDITPRPGKNGNFDFDVFHGFRPDFDPDKINLMERSLASTPLNIFLEKLRDFEKEYPGFCLVIFDCKLNDIGKRFMSDCGKQLAEQVINNFYNSNSNDRIYTIFSIPKKKHISLIDGIVSRVPKDLRRYIGFDISMEKFQAAERVFGKRNEANFWWGSGIASTVPKPLKHFIPQFLIAADKRAKREIIKKIYYWTLDDPDSMARILVTKLDGIIVNDPLKLLKVLEKEEFKHTYRLANRDDNPFNVIR